MNTVLTNNEIDVINKFLEFVKENLIGSNLLTITESPKVAFAQHKALLGQFKDKAKHEVFALLVMTLCKPGTKLTDYIDILTSKMVESSSDPLARLDVGIRLAALCSVIANIDFYNSEIVALVKELLKNELVKEMENEMNTEIKEVETINNVKLQEWVTSLNKYSAELTKLVGIMSDENCDLNNYVFSPTSINHTLVTGGRVICIKRRKEVISLLEELSGNLTTLATMLQDEDNRSVKTITNYALSVDLITTYDMLTPFAVEGLSSYGEARRAVLDLRDDEKVARVLGLYPELDDPLTLDTITDVHCNADEVVKITNPNDEPLQCGNSLSSRFNLVTDIHRAVEANFEQHDKYFGGYDETDMASLMNCGYLIGRELNDFLGSVIDEEDKLPNGISLLELIIINNNMAFIANLATIDSPIRSFELYVWNVNKFLPDVVEGKVGVLQQMLNRLKDLTERLYSPTGVTEVLKALFGFGLDLGRDVRGSRSNGDSRSRVGLGRGSLSRSHHLVSRDEELDREEDLRDREEDLRDREEEMDRYYRDHGRRGRYFR